MTIIDFDDPSSFPKALSNWDLNFERMIRGKISLDGVTEGWQIEHQLSDLRIDEMPIVLNYLNAHLDLEVAVSHCTRILDIEQFKKEGLITGGGRGSVADVRLRQLLKSVGLESNMTEMVMSKVYSYWGRDGKQRTECVHFFFDSNQVYKDDRVSAFALNIGGEVLRWALSGCG